MSKPSIVRNTETKYGAWCPLHFFQFFNRKGAKFACWIWFVFI